MPQVDQAVAAQKAAESRATQVTSGSQAAKLQQESAMLQKQLAAATLDKSVGGGSLASEDLRKRRLLHSRSAANKQQQEANLEWEQGDEGAGRAQDAEVKRQQVASLQCELRAAQSQVHAMR